MEQREENKEKVIIAGLHTGSRDYLNDTTDESMRELGELVDTAGGEVVGEMVQNRPMPDSGTYFGEGKLEELKDAIDALEATLVNEAVFLFIQHLKLTVYQRLFFVSKRNQFLVKIFYFLLFFNIFFYYFFI